MPNNYIVSDYQLTSIADAIRARGNTTDELVFPNGFINGVKTIPGIPIDINITINGNVDPVTGKWVRPQEYPNLDAIDYGGSHNICYMTYDLRKTPDYAWIGVWVNGSGSYTLDRGHLENNVFVVDETHTVTLGSYYRQNLDSSNGDIQLWRILSSNTNITGFGFCPNTETNANNYVNQLQPCVDRKGYFDYAETLWGDTSTAYNARKHCTMWMERDALVMSRYKTLYSWSGVWSGAYRLVELDFSEWDASMWRLTSFGSNWGACYSLRTIDLSWINSTSLWTVGTFSGNWTSCYSLKSLDLSNFDTSNWVVTNMNYNWGSCISLEEIKMNFDTHNWEVQRLDDCWTNCRSLRSLDIGGWDTSNWAVTTLAGTWSNCSSLRELPIGGWDTSNWVVTSIGSTFNGCSSLLELDLSHWDTSNWRVTGMTYAFASCHSLRTLNVNSWDVSKWTIPSLSTVWYNCMSLKELKLNNWDTSNWTVTTLANAWNGCVSLKVLDVGSWDTSKWAVTSLANTWSNCYALHELKLNNWDTSDWAVTTMSQTFYYCLALQNLEVSEWDTSNWAVTNLSYAFYYCFCLSELDISKWDTSNWAVTTNNYMFAMMNMLQTCKTPTSLGLTTATANNAVPSNSPILRNYTVFSISQNHSYSSSYCLSRESLISIISRLPTVSGKTITLGVSHKSKLTAEEIAVATQKGWTVA